MSLGVGNIIRQQKKQGGSAVINSVNNALTLTSGLLQWGGALVKTTEVSGSGFNVGFTMDLMTIGVDPATATVHKLYCLKQGTTSISNGEASGLFVNELTASTVQTTGNFYGLVGTANFTNSSTQINGADTFNATAVHGSLVVTSNNGSASTRRLRAITASITLTNTRADNLAALEAKAVEVSGTNIIGNIYGLYIGAMKATGVTTGYGIYQTDSADLNYMAGALMIGTTTPVTNNLLHIRSTTVNGEAVRFSLADGNQLKFVMTSGAPTLSIKNSGATAWEIYQANGTALFITGGSTPITLRTDGGQAISFQTSLANRAQVEGAGTFSLLSGLKKKANVSSATTLTLDALNIFWVFTGGVATTWTLPALAGNTGLFYMIKNRGSANITLQRAGADEIYTTTNVTSITILPGESKLIENDGTYWNVI